MVFYYSKKPWRKIKMGKNICFVVTLLGIMAFANVATAATLKCGFLRQYGVSKSGELVTFENDFFKVHDNFSGELTLDLQNSLLAKLETQ